MRRHVCRPEVSGCLEARSLLSGVAGLAADPVVFPRRRFNQVVEQIDLGFEGFADDRFAPDLLRHLYSNAAVIIPFGRVDGLGVSINRIVNQMQDDLSAHVPHAIRSARNELLAVIHAEVEARVRAGDVVVR